MTAPIQMQKAGVSDIYKISIPLTSSNQMVYATVQNRDKSVLFTMEASEPLKRFMEGKPDVYVRGFAWPDKKMLRIVTANNGLKVDPVLEGCNW